MHTALEQSILQTLHYFALAEHPLTFEELYANLWQPPRITYAQFKAVWPQHAHLAVEKQGFIMLLGHEANILQRKNAQVESALKLKKARRAANIILIVPFIRAVLVCNSVGRETAREQSDIDFFIIAEKKRLWLVRLFSNLLLRALGLRTYGTKTKNRVCLSFYIGTDQLNLAPWRVAPDDIHLAYWLHQMLPLFDPDHWYSRFIKANAWTKNFLPHATVSSYPLVADGPLRRGFRKFWETMWRASYGDLIESQAKAIQWQKIAPALKKQSTDGSHGVVFAEGIIKLHEHDTRRKIREEWLTKISKS